MLDLNSAFVWNTETSSQTRLHFLFLFSLTLVTAIPKDVQILQLLDNKIEPFPTLHLDQNMYPCFFLWFTEHGCQGRK